MKDEMRDERLRRILRETDPARADAELTPEELRAMRRTVLTATPQPHRRWLGSPVLAGVAMAILAAIAILVFRPGMNSSPGMNSRATDGVPSGITQKPPVRNEILSGPHPGLNHRPTIRQAVVPDGTTGGSPAASAPGGGSRRKRIHHDRIATTEPQTRQVQFSTPGGTRVIWILTSDKAL
jgi:hypothetical protein